MKKFLCTVLFSSIFVSPVILADDNSHALYQSDSEYQQLASNAPRSLASRNMPHNFEDGHQQQQPQQQVHQHQHQHGNQMSAANPADEHHHHQYHHQHHKYHTNNGHKNVHDAKHQAMNKNKADKRQVD